MIEGGQTTGTLIDRLFPAQLPNIEWVLLPTTLAFTTSVTSCSAAHPYPPPYLHPSCELHLVGDKGVISHNGHLAAANGDTQEQYKTPQ